MLMQVNKINFAPLEAMHTKSQQGRKRKPEKKSLNEKNKARVLAEG